MQRKEGRKEKEKGRAGGKEGGEIPVSSVPEPILCTEKFWETFLLLFT